MNNTSPARISVTTATIIGMNAMIGSGIFVAPAAMACYVGPAGILTYALVVVSVWFTALSLARLAYLFPEDGAFYVYVKQWGGHTMGMVAGFSYFAGLVIAMGLLSQVAGHHLHELLPQSSEVTLGLITLLSLTLLNLCNVALSTLGQHILICTTLFPLVAVTLLCLFNSNLQNLVPFAPHGFSNVFKAMRMVVFGFFGFECAASLSSMVENPKKNVPIALTYSIFIVGALYTLFVGSVILAIPLHCFVDPRIPLARTLSALFPENTWLIGAIHLAVLSAIIGTIHSMIWSSSALLLSLVKRVQSPTVHRWLKKTPAETARRFSVITVASGIFLSFMLLHNIDLFFSLTALFIETAFLLSMITLLTIPSEWKSGHNVKTIIGIGTALMIMYFAAEGLVLELAKIL